MKTNFKLILIFTFLLSGCEDTVPLYTSVCGTIKNDAGELLQNVDISAVLDNDENYGPVSTDAYGRFCVDNLKSGKYVFTFKKDGYDITTKDLTVNINNKPEDLNMTLSKKKSGLSPSKSIVEFTCSGDKQQSVFISNSLGKGNIDFVVQVQETAKYWLSVNKTSGTVKDKIDFELVISVNCANLGFGDYSGVITLQNAEVNEKILVNLKIANPKAPSVSITQQVNSITKTSASFVGTILSEGDTKITEHGFVWAEFENPSLESRAGIQNKGVGSLGTFTGSATGLKENTNYFVRAFAKNSQGVQYSENRPFKTAQTTTSPSVNILKISEITTTTAKITGIVTDDGGESITEMGIRYGTRENNLDQVSQSIIIIGKDFLVPINGLNPGVTYFAAVYAKNKIGTSTSSIFPFTTESTSGSIDIRTSGAENIKENSATLNGELKDFTGAISEYGFVYSRKNALPTLQNGEKIPLGANPLKEVPFSKDVSNLKKGTLYWVRAFATGQNGKTTYGNVTQLVTKESGLVVYYPMNQSLADVSNINGNNASGSAKYEADRFGNANLSFDATSGKIQIQNETIGRYINSYSISFWVNFSQSSFKNGTVLFSKSLAYGCDSRSDWLGYKIYFDAANSVLKFSIKGRKPNDNTYKQYFTEINLISEDELQNKYGWYHITLVKNGTQLQVYLDGSKNDKGGNTDIFTYGSDSDYTANTDGEGKFTFGDLSSLECNNNLPNVLIDDFRIYNYALTAIEVRDIYSR
ncbi:carboxypeptidase regulatory-like domain-containing protein [Emticicia sp. W12TSBA100-4]|uniref:carboxypeptidase regulatory-like domain-containing protein n=1 Tax=Emticicia sp. W12TSBA100-4 TaxID=3160965 RepID=UPI003305BC79